MSIGAFMDQCDYPIACVNVLDFPNLTPDIPHFISCVFPICKHSLILTINRSMDDLSHAWMGTIGYSWVKTSQVATKRVLSKDANQLRASMGIKGEKRKNVYELSGPETIRFDSQRMMNWVLITKAGFYTFVHHDSNGLLTWVMVSTGSKIWGLWRIKDHTGTQIGQWRAHMDTGFDRCKSGDLFNALLVRGAVL
jgi:hypothetical protein